LINTNDLSASVNEDIRHQVKVRIDGIMAEVCYSDLGQDIFIEEKITGTFPAVP
jgi:hypothetical protein